VRYYRLYGADDDPGGLLRAEQQRSRPWGGSGQGHCEKCDGRGRVRYRCRSCLESGARAECPACGGKVEFEDVCPTCRGDGVVDDEDVNRVGVSVFPAEEGLYRYLVECDADLEGQVIVEVDGELAPERDIDADMGALLVIPTRVRGECPIDWQRVERLRRRFR
jgi:hypothetical protein